MTRAKARKGATLVLSLIFVLVFAALAIGMVTLSGTNLQLASDQHDINAALVAAQSGQDAFYLGQCFPEPVVFPAPIGPKFVFAGGF